MRRMNNSGEGWAGGEGPPAPESREVKLRKLGFYRSEIKHEFALLTDRVSTCVTSQSFLCAAYASAIAQPESAPGQNLYAHLSPRVCVARRYHSIARANAPSRRTHTSIRPQ